MTTTSSPSNIGEPESTSRLRQDGIDVGAEGSLQRLALAQPHLHLVEGEREVTKTVGRGHRYRLPEVTVTHASGRSGEIAERGERGPDEEDAEQHEHVRGDQRGDGHGHDDEGLPRVSVSAPKAETITPLKRHVEPIAT